MAKGERGKGSSKVQNAFAGACPPSREQSTRTVNAHPPIPNTRPPHPPTHLRASPASQPASPPSLPCQQASSPAHVVNRGNASAQGVLRCCLQGSKALLHSKRWDAVCRYREVGWCGGVGGRRGWLLASSAALPRSPAQQPSRNTHLPPAASRHPSAGRWAAQRYPVRCCHLAGQVSLRQRQHGARQLYWPDQSGRHGAVARWGCRQ